MSISEMQACLARLYIDDSFRDLFSINPEATIEEYKLTEEEVAAIESIDKKMLDFFASSLKHKRRRKFEKAYTLLFQVNRKETIRYYNRYYQLYPARPGQSTLDQVLEFGEFMEETLATDEDFPPYASELAKYERLIFAAKFSPTPNDTFRGINKSLNDEPEPVKLTSHPTVREEIYLGNFKFDIVSIAEELRQDRQPADLEKGEYCFVFQQVENSLRPKLFRINSATERLINLCDGSRCVHEIIEEMEADLNRENMKDDILQMVEHLSISLNVLQVRNQNQ